VWQRWSIPPESTVARIDRRRRCCLNGSPHAAGQSTRAHRPPPRAYAGGYSIADWRLRSLSTSLVRTAEITNETTIGALPRRHGAARDSSPLSAATPIIADGELLRPWISPRSPRRQLGAIACLRYMGYRCSLESWRVRLPRHDPCAGLRPLLRCACEPAGDIP
jgi:hypothetical protein